MNEEAKDKGSSDTCVIPSVAQKNAENI